ncbi:hypothetical protein OG292_02550 [Streptomyces sp. NBC_01511]|uniref:hypothetical protein n=1 Tax=Streptomyces sp. NBC_01511 TaxID=2903889 RepID=UPI0038663933
MSVEGAVSTDRLDYLYQHYIEPVRARFIPVFDLLREQGRIKNIPAEVFYFLVTSGGTAPYGQTGVASLMNPDLASTEETRVRLYAENVAEVLINGLSLTD